MLDVCKGTASFDRRVLAKEEWPECELIPDLKEEVSSDCLFV